MSASKFATLLRRLLDDTGIYNRGGWARYLGVSQNLISNWVCDKMFPTSEKLRQIYEIVEQHDFTPITEEILLLFEDMASEPSNEVSPLGKYMGPTIKRYMLKDLELGFLADLQKLPLKFRKQILLEARQRCSEERGHFDNLKNIQRPRCSCGLGDEARREFHASFCAKWTTAASKVNSARM